MHSNSYTGHGAATGGLQRHSIGELYPLDVYGQQVNGETLYGVVDLATGEETGARWDVYGATELAREIKRVREASRAAAELSRKACAFWRAERAKREGASE